MNTPALDEDFLEFESKVSQLAKLLDDISNANKKEGEDTKEKKKEVKEDISEKDFIVTIKKDRTSINRSSTETGENKDAAEMDKFTFMRQLEEDAEERAKVKQERERIAQKFRTLGNDAFRKQNYEKAVIMYTKAIEHVKDSPILYNNRALAYMKLKNYKRGIMDCDYVLTKLEEKNLTSWLYRAAGYKRCIDDMNFEASIKLAKKHNPNKIDEIEVFLEKFARESI